MEQGLGETLFRAFAQVSRIFPATFFSFRDLYWLYPTSTHQRRKLHMSVVCKTVLGQASSGPLLSSRLCILHLQETTIMHTMMHVNTHAASCKRHWQEQSLSRTLDAIFRILPSFGLSTLSDLRSGVGCMIVDIQLEVRISCELYLILAGLPVGTPTLLIFYIGLGYLTAS